jgi:hypothetical protein
MFEYSEDNSDSDKAPPIPAKQNYNYNQSIKVESDEEKSVKISSTPIKQNYKKAEPQPDEEYLDSTNFVSSGANEKVSEHSLSEDDIEELKELICNWLELDDKTKELSDQMKDLKSEKKQYETYILAFMDKANKEVIKSKDNTCTLRKEVKETKGSLKEEHILKTLSAILQNSEQAYKITQKIIEELPSKETISLKKEKNQKPTKKTKKSTKKDI